jgi:hypothetical protein
VNFTREPIIETIVSPKDGYKLCIRNSKLPGAEELVVDAVEVVSFGTSLFFRGQERPKPFLVPVSDYEIFEVKETRVVLKNIAHDRSIKIGGGREASLKSNKEHAVERKEEVEEVKEVDALAPVGEASTEPKNDRKRDRRRSRRRRLAAEKRGSNEPNQGGEASGEQSEEDDDDVVEPKPIPVFTHLLPPPPVLISERLSQLRNKEMAEAASAGLALEGEVKETFMEEVDPSEMHKVTLDEDDEDFNF